MVLVLALGAMMVGALLILLIARFDPAANKAPLVVGTGGMPLEAFRTLIIDLLDKLSLHITHISSNATEIEIFARTRTALIAGKYLVHAYAAPPSDLVPSDQVLRLQEQVKAEAAAKGILITPYAIERAGVAHLDVELELVDGKRLRALVEEHLPDRLDQLAKYRGFGFWADA